MIYKQHSTLAYTKLDPPGAVNFNRWTPSSGLQFQPPLAPPPQSGWWLATQQDLKAPKWQLMGYIFLMGIHIYIYMMGYMVGDNKHYDLGWSGNGGFMAR